MMHATENCPGTALALGPAHENGESEGEGQPCRLRSEAVDASAHAGEPGGGIRAAVRAPVDHDRRTPASVRARAELTSPTWLNA